MRIDSFRKNGGKKEGLGEVSFLGVRVHLKTMSELLELLTAQIEENRKVVIANHNLHSLCLFHRDSKLRDFYAGVEWCHIDGMPLVLLARLFGFRAKRSHRTTYADWMGPLVELASKNKWRIFYLGSAPGIAARGADILCARYPGLQIRTMHGYFSMEPDNDDNRRIIRSIAEYKPHILMIGMGMPRQELWIQQNREVLASNVILPCGAAMDYVAGAVHMPPRWAGRVGLEWAFRLMDEPGRLWRRYLVEPWSLAGIVLQQIIKSRILVGRAPSTKQ
jgi:N-acetylglucosaminyldiphosphoundecaprenol N-acetyl-beta-D-mannosaminyltransferase